MGKQSSRIYFNGKDHKDIYFNGKLHKAMYFKDQGGIIWQKLSGILNSVGCAINSYYVGSTIAQGINAFYPEIREIISTRYNPQYSNIFTTIIRGKKQAFAYNSIETNLFNHIWLSNNGTYWKKIELSKKVSGIISCLDGFLYYNSSSNSWHNVVLDENNVSYENVNGFKLVGSRLTGKNYNGIWTYSTKETPKISFTTRDGIILDYDFGTNYISFGSTPQCFTDYTYNYAYAMVIENVSGYETPHYYFLTCDGVRITATKNEKIPQIEYIIPWKNSFYLFGWSVRSSAEVQVYETTDFAGEPTLIEEWYKNDYIELDLIGGSRYGVDVIRLFMGGEFNSLYPIKAEIKANVMNVTINKHSVSYNNYVEFLANNIADSGIILTTPSYNLAIYLDSPIITKTTKGFAYFTENIGVGVSYP